MYGVVWLSIIGSSGVRVFARMLGFSEFEFGLMTAIPNVANVAQLLASVLLERTGLRKYQFLYCSSVHRLLWLVVAVIPFALPVPSRVAVVCMLLTLAFSWFMNALGAPAWLMWMGDLIPRRIRGRYFANRFQYSRLVQIMAVVGLSLVLDWATRKNPDGSITETAQAQPLLLYTISAIFAVSAVLGVIDVLLFRRVREVMPTVVNEHPAPILQIDIPRPTGFNPFSAVAYGLRYAWAVVYEMLLEPLKDPLFRSYVGYGTTLLFAANLPGWYYWRHCMEWYGFNNLATNFLFLVISPVMGLVGSHVWGRLLDRWGRRPTLILASTLIVFSSMPYFFATRDFPRVEWVVDMVNWVARLAGSLFGLPNCTWLRYDMPVGAYLMVMLACFIGGVGWTGVNLSQTNVMLHFAHGSGRSRFVTASAVFLGVGGTLGGVIGGIVAENLHWMQHAPFTLGPLKYNNWNVTFALSIVLRAVALLWLINMPDPGARKMRDLIRVVRTAAYANITNWLFFPVKLFDRSRRDYKDDEKDDDGGQ